MPATLDWRLGLSALIGICVAAGFVLGVSEILELQRSRALRRERIGEMLLSLSPLPVNVLVTLGLAGFWGALYAEARALAPVHWPVNATTFALAFVAADFSYYWEHRCAHRVPWLWGLYHAIHHSSADYTIATAYRVSFINQTFSPAFYLPWVLLGFDPLLIAGWQLFAFHYQAWLHTETIGTLGWLDRWFNTPAVHRVHHSRAAEHRDRNLGAVTMIWDRCFGTYTAPVAILRYGIPGIDPPRSMRGLYVDPWRRWLAKPLSLRNEVVDPSDRGRCLAGIAPTGDPV
ncbi:MAG TPA: sterol desaturase family protein [Rhodanobacteraceae bacterium]